jgi:hypothetical protein
MYMLFLFLYLAVASLSLSILPESNLVSLHFPLPPASHTASTLLAGTTLIKNQSLALRSPV